MSNWTTAPKMTITSDLAVGPDRRAYHRDQRYTIDSALRTAHIDQVGRTPHIWGEAGEDFLDIVLWLLDDATFGRWQRRQREMQASGQPTERKLTDFA